MYRKAGQRYQDAYNYVISHYEKFRFIEEFNIRVKLLESDKERVKGIRRIWADCTKLSEKLRAASDCDFIITFYKCDVLSEDRLRILMYHEVLHMGYTKDGKLKINPHDVEDFREIIEEHGVDWIKD